MPRARMNRITILSTILPLILGLTLHTPAQDKNKKNQGAMSTGTPVLWREPTNIKTRSLSAFEPQQLYPFENFHSLHSFGNSDYHVCFSRYLYSGDQRIISGALDHSFYYIVFCKSFGIEHFISFQFGSNHLYLNPITLNSTTNP